MGKRTIETRGGRMDFDSIDWIDLCNQLGLYVKNPNEPVILSVCEPEDRFVKATIIASDMLGNPKLPYSYVRDQLEFMEEQAQITSFDKAWIRLHVNRILRDAGRV
jgi:hypothetical protein